MNKPKLIISKQCKEVSYFIYTKKNTCVNVTFVYVGGVISFKFETLIFIELIINYYKLL